MAAVSAIVVTNLIVIAYVVVAYFEDGSNYTAKKNE